MHTPDHIYVLGLCLVNDEDDAVEMVRAPCIANSYDLDQTQVHHEIMNIHTHTHT